MTENFFSSQNDGLKVYDNVGLIKRPSLYASE
jgi:hypothetical protein